MTTRPEIFISVDIKATGPIPGEYSMISIDACDAYRPEATFSCLVALTSGNVVPEAMAQTGISLSILESGGLPPEVAMKQFAEWIFKISGAGIPVLVALNAPFAWSFVNYYFIRYHGSSPFEIGAVDIKALSMGANQCSWQETRSLNEKAAAGAQGVNKHKALDDVQSQAELFRRLWKA
jgi:DNA polymerase III epsilon subunit-like protein